MHLINQTTPAPQSSTLQHIFALEVLAHQTDDLPACTTKPELTYHMIPCNMSVVQANKKLKLVHEWLMFFERPKGMSDREYELLTKYTE